MAFALIFSINASLFTLELRAEPSQVLKTGVKAFSTKGISLKLIPETIVDTSLSMEGDLFSAFLTKPSAEILKVPSGSRLIGTITDIEEKKSLNRGAKLKAHVNTLMLPDGTKIKVSADFSSKASWQETETSNSFKNTARKLAQGSAEISASTLVGAIDAVQYTGIGLAISTHGISTAVGAGIGLGLGLYGAITKEGSELASSGFKAIDFRLESEFEFLEKITIIGQKIEPISASLLGIEMKVNSVEKFFSKNYGEFIMLDLSLSNNSYKKLFIGDFVLSSDMNIVPVMNNPLLTNIESLNSIAIGESTRFKLAFSTGSIRKNYNYQLFMIDPATQDLLANLEVDISSYL
jgi:hypothetical protein